MSAESQMFDVLGHIDALKGFYPEIAHLKTEAVDDALQAIAESGSVIESEPNFMEWMSRLAQMPISQPE
ncbi:hypothetical protein CGLO_18204 [Colletotrichum gloeosporioides Cg-14]|uniref:Uncharacterized protein n=1 Tax=Colletotrichum gloeosporioides (strain Cg-14) TaxID=1237896 RepID=T0KV42_COLGC|nr:hypothetical protein CGLO_18204 [Colletotrichum gloeosporioides Cg-14]